MSIHLHFYNIIIPIEKIEKDKKVKNLKNTIKFYLKRNKRNIWHDDYLFTIGGIMGPRDVENEVKVLEEIGFKPFKQVNGEQYWNDICVTDFTSGPTLPCSWLKCHIDPYNYSYAWLADQNPGKMIDINSKNFKKELNLFHKIKNYLKI